VYFSVLIPLISAFFGAIASTISKEIVDEVGSSELTVLTFIFMSILMIPIMPFFFSMSNLTIGIPLIALIVILDSFANLLFFKGLTMEEVSRASALNSLSPLFTAILTPLILPDQFGWSVFLAAIGITLSVYMLQTSHGVREFITHLKYEKNYLIILSALIFGSTAIPTRMVLNELAVTNSVTLYWIRAIGISIVAYAIMRPDITSLSRRNCSIIGVKSVFVIISWVLLFYSISNFNLIFSYSLAKTVPLFTLFIAWEELDEEITLRKISAIVVLIASITATKLI